MAWNIGANDISNAMGTSVGSKALTLKKAVFLAALLEFSGAFFMGSHVSSTIQEGIIKPSVFTAEPMIFALGMTGALLAASLWLNVASYLSLPISATQGLIGAVFGFGFTIGGFDAIFWKEVIIIGSSWVIAPLLGCLVSYTIFRLLQKKVLFSLNPLESAKKIVPFLVFLSIAFFVFCVVFKGQKAVHLDFSFFPALLIALVFGTLFTIFTLFHIKKMPPSTPLHTQNMPEHAINLEKAVKHLQRTKLSSHGELYEKTSAILADLKNLTFKVKKEVEYSESTSEYIRVEKIFGYLQVTSACMVAFAHGANDVANSIGPVAAVTQVVKTNLIPETFTIPVLLLLLGGIGIVIGLATWGWRVIGTIGKKITELTPTRGFSAEIGTALTILIASKFGLPISTTHVLVGAVFGVGFAKGFNSLNLSTLKSILLSWIITIPTCAILSIGIFHLLKLIFI